MNTINLKDLWYYKDINDLPEWVYTKNCIYLCKCLVNNKSYIGQTAQSLFGRWSGSNQFSHNYGYECNCQFLIYRAIRKYGPNNFEVLILEDKLSSKELRNEREIYWISELHTYYLDPLGPGYNMTKGGEDASQLHTLEAEDRRNKVWKSNRLIWLSIPGNKEEELKIIKETIHSSEVRKRALDTYHKNRKEYLKDPENVKAELNYIHNVLHSPEANLKNREISIRNRKEWIKDPNNLIKEREVLNKTILSKEVRHEATLIKTLNFINQLIDNLRSKGRPLTSEYYYQPDGPESNWNYYNRIKTQMKYLPELRLMDGWTELHESIFSRFYYDDNHHLCILDLKD